MKSIINFILDWIWQLPQNLIGVIYGGLIEKSKPIKTPYEDCVIRYKYTKNSVTLGKFVYICVFDKNKEFTIKHERGHVIQSIILGPLYLLVIGLPSIIWAWLYKKIAPNKSYYWFYTEAWANKLSNI